MIADSSFLISLFLEEDENHTKAIEEFSNLNNATILIPDRVIEEIFTVITYKMGIIYSLLVIEKINLNQRFIIYFMDLSDNEAIFCIIKKIKAKCSFIDYCIAYLSITKDEQLLCYDKEIINIIKKYKQIF